MLPVELPKTVSDYFEELGMDLIQDDFGLSHHKRLTSLQLAIESPLALFLVSSLPCSVMII